MAQSLILDVRGLHTYASELGVPAGSLAVAENVNINRDGVIEPRKGYDHLGYTLDNIANKLVFWNNELFVHDNANLFYYDTESGYIDRGSLVKPNDSTAVFMVNSQNKNMYSTSNIGLIKTDSISTSLYSAGIPKGLTIDLSLSGVGTALENGSFATYRYIIGRKDQNSNFQYGGVSGKFTIENSAGSTQNVSVKCYIPSGLDETYFIQLYKNTATTSPVSDELQLCYETPLSSSDLSNGYVTISDIVPSDMVGATIYTAPSQEGLVADNALPPLSRDIAEYKNYMFYADVESLHRLTFSLVSVNSPGFQVGDTITITMGDTTEVYTGVASGSFNATNKYFEVYTVSSSASVNIDNTIKSFIKCVNLSSTVVYAYSMSTSENDLPGKVMLEARTLGSDEFTAVSSRSAAFQPQLVTTTNVNNTSENDTFKNGLMFSKQYQPEAVPMKNLIKVGSSDDRILRIVALREGLFILKENNGVFVLRGDNEFNFSVQLLDNTAKLVAPRSIAVVNNLIYGLFQAGISEISDTGVSIISNPIKDQILPLFGSPLSIVKTNAFGVGADVDGKYILSIPVLSTDSYTTRQIVFDTFGRTFVNWTMKLSAGGHNPYDSKLYLASSLSPIVIKERKDADYTDYADYTATCTVSSYDGTTLFIDNTDKMAAGDILYQGTTALAYIESVDTATGSCVIDTEQEWTTDEASIYLMSAIDCKVQWNPDTGGNAGALKHYYECNVISKSNFQKKATLYFSSDVNPAESSIEITSPSGNGAFGQFVFGDSVWGGDQSSSPKRVGIPRGHARCTLLNIRFENKIAYSDFQITGLALSFNITSTRIAR